jgi:putative N6-adenine-specific DNA methylase
VTPPVVGRGGLKLEAAIARFGLAPKLAGARAIDVGASTGGFTEAMLRHGAAHVTAIDVGRGQLHPSLASDARVESIEGVHFAKLPLGVAAGPYDFFSVDVSFVAARTMLRGLAFRLRDGAEGVILVKPQFELPDKAVRSGDVSDPQLRARALEAVRTRAEALGFRLLEAIDSPVAGGSGTVEILTHLRFEGRSEKLPKLGERRRRDEQPAASTRGLPPRLRYFAIAAPGLEAVVRDEVAALPGAFEIAVETGGVTFVGDLALARAANLRLRTATRVLLRLGVIEAREFSRLRRAAARLPFAAVVPATAQLTFHVAQTRSRLYHTGAVAETLAHAVADALGVRSLPVVKPSEAEAALDADDGAAIAAIYARGVADRWTISVDTSGALLHRRGWRTEAGEAPIRETLAAGILALAEWDPATPLVDPTCGSGTFVVEAALRALGRAPGRGRRFACDRWPSAPPPIADAPPSPSLPPILVGSDADPQAIAIARRNAERAGVADHVSFAVAPLADAAPPEGAPAGLVVANPPYGRRLDDARGAASAYRALGEALRRRFRGWRVAVLVPESRPGPLERALGLHPVTRHTLTNGGLRVTLLVSRIRGHT